MSIDGVILFYSATDLAYFTIPFTNLVRDFNFL